jgi:hypothetical protein
VHAKKAKTIAAGNQDIVENLTEIMTSKFRFKITSSHCVSETVARVGNCYCITGTIKTPNDFLIIDGIDLASESLEKRLRISNT